MRALGGSALQINLVQLARTFLAGWFAYRLALRICGRTAPSVLAGAAFTFAPFCLIHGSGHLNLVHIFWIPLSLLALLGLVERPGRRTGVLLGACVAGAVLTDPQIGLLCLLAMAPVIVHRWSDVRAAVRPGIVAAVTAALLALPVVVPTLLAMRRGEADPVRGFAFPEGYSTDLAAWVVPPARHPIWGAAAARIFEPITLERGLSLPVLADDGTVVVYRTGG